MVLGAAALAPADERPDVEAATLMLEAASLAGDRDLAYERADIERFRAYGWVPETRVALDFDAFGRHRFARPLAYPLLAAPFEALAPGRGARVLNALLLALAAALAVRHLEPRLGDGAAWLVTAVVFGSATFGYALAARPETLLVAAMVAALSLAWPRAEGHLPRGASRLPEMNPAALGSAAPDAPPAPTGGSLARWLAAGALIGVVALHHPLYAVLVLALLGGVPRRLRRAAIPTVAVGLVAVLTVAWLAGTLWVEFGASPKLAIAADEPADLAARGASPAAAADRRPVWPPPLADFQLLARNLAYLAVGRHIGLVVYFLPLLLVLGLGGGAAARGRMLAATAIVLAGLVVLHPFDLAGGGGPGVRWFAPLYAGLWLTPARPPGRVAAVALLLVGALLMAPLWRGLSPAAAGPAAALFDRLPFEVTQRAVPVAAEIVRRGARVRAASADIAAGGGGRAMRLGAGGRGQLMIAADRPLAAIDLEFGAEARGEPEIAGGELSQMVFRPDGGVTYRVRPRRPARHATWWSDRQHVYSLSFSLPETRVAVAFDVSVE